MKQKINYQTRNGYSPKLCSAAHEADITHRYYTIDLLVANTVRKIPVFVYQFQCGTKVYMK